MPLEINRNDTENNSFYLIHKFKWEKWVYNILINKDKHLSNNTTKRQDNDTHNLDADTKYIEASFQEIRQYQTVKLTTFEKETHGNEKQLIACKY